RCRARRRGTRRPLVVGRRCRQRVRHPLHTRWTRAAHRRRPAQRYPGTDARVKHQGFTLWLTGMSGAGKSTISDQLMERFRNAKAKSELLDGDVVRTNLSQGLGFSREDRDTNIRRIGFVAELLSRNGVIVVVAAISPYRQTREEVKKRIANF